MGIEKIDGCPARPERGGAVEQRVAVEGRGAGRAIHGRQDRVDLALDGLLLRVGKPGGIGGSHCQPVGLDEQIGGSCKRPVGDVGDMVSPQQRPHLRFEAAQDRPEVLRGDQARRVVGSTIDPLPGGQLLN